MRLAVQPRQPDPVAHQDVVEGPVDRAEEGGPLGLALQRRRARPRPRRSAHWPRRCSGLAGENRRRPSAPPLRVVPPLTASRKAWKPPVRRRPELMPISCSSRSSRLIRCMRSLCRRCQVSRPVDHAFQPGIHRANKTCTSRCRCKPRMMRTRLICIYLAHLSLLWLIGPLALRYGENLASISS